MVQAYLHNGGLQRSNARCDFEEHGPEEVGIRRHLPGTINVAIIPVKKVKADALLLIVAAGVETTQISNRHMKALDAIARHAFARSERVAAVIGCGEWEQVRLEQEQNSQDIMYIHSYTSIY